MARHRRPGAGIRVNLARPRRGERRHARRRRGRRASVPAATVSDAHAERPEPPPPPQAEPEPERAAASEVTAELSDTGPTAAAGTGPPAAPEIGPAARRLEPLRPTARPSRLRRSVLVLGLLLLAAALVVGAIGHFGPDALLDRARELVGGDTPETEIPPDGLQPTLLVASYLDDGGNGQLRGLTVLAHDRSSGEGTVLLVPVSTVVDVPGFGSFTFEEAWRFGGPSLIGVTLDNLLGIRTDGVAAVSELEWQELLGRVGGVEVEVRAPVRASDGAVAGQIRFEAGRQFLDARRAAEYLMIRGEGETEIDGLPRTQQIVLALLDALVADPALLDAIDAIGRELPTTAAPDRLGTVVGELAEARVDDRVVVLTLPVSPIGTSADDRYRYDGEVADSLVAERFGPSLREGAGVGRNVQILNGNGQPGVGREVTELLAEGGYRILLTGNADRFDHPTTRILIYDDTAEHLEVARDVRERLGVGVIERSATPQSVVDLTIIVGADFPP
jgi:polyisoprenyl-teichoic acid--peptidoglycan teichoic acid transferase